MKKVFFFLLLFGSASLYSQPVLSSLSPLTSGMEVDELIVVANAEPTGGSGENVSWDFEHLDFTLSLPVRSEYISPSSTPVNAFLFSNLAERTASNHYQYYKSNATVKELLGVYSPLIATTIYYTNSMILEKAPLTYNESYSDSFSASGVSALGTLFRTGTSSAIYDGYGTLTLANETYQNTVRVKSVLTEKDSIAGSPVTSGRVVVKYSWLSDGSQIPLLIKTITKSFYNNGLESDTVTTETFSRYEIVAVSGFVENSAASFNVAPNPAKDFIDVSFKNPFTGSISLINDLGEIVSKNEVKEISFFKVGTEKYKEGLYLLQMESEAGMQTKKICIRQ